MSKFQFKKEKLPQLTLQDIRDCGWEQKEMDNIKTGNVMVFFEKNNYFLSCYSFKEQMPVIRIHAKDPSKIEWMPDPENFRMTFQCPSKELFEIITSTL